MKKVTILLTLLMFFVGGCKKGDLPFQMSEWDREARHQFNGSGIPDTDTDFKHDYSTPRGMKVKSTRPIPPDFLRYADEAVQSQIDRLSGIFPEWSDWKEVSQYRLLVIEPGRAGGTAYCVTEVNDPGSPCLYVTGSQKAAGIMLGGDDNWDELDIYPAMVVPHQEFQNWTKIDWWKNSIHNESEHVRGWKNRQRNPQNVYYHFRNDGVNFNDVHPWTWGEAKSLVSEKKANHIVQ